MMRERQFWYSFEFHNNVSGIAECVAVTEADMKHFWSENDV